MRTCVWACIVAAGAAGCGRAERRATEAPAARAHISAGGSWGRGDRCSYVLHLSSRLDVGSEARRLMDFDLDGELEVIAVESKGPGATLHGAVRAARFTNRGGSTKGADFEALGTELASGAFWGLDRGLVAEYRFSAETTDFASTIFRQLASSLQFSDEARSGRQVLVAEFDGTGKYEAKYEAGARNQYGKQKARYLEVLAAGGASPQSHDSALLPRLTSSRADLTVDDANRPVRLSSSESVDVSLGGAAMHGDTRVTLDRVKCDSLIDTGQLLGESQRATRIAASAPYMRERVAFDDVRIGDLGFDEIVERLKAISTDTQSSQISGTVNGTPPPDEERTRREGRVREHGRLFSGLSAILRTDARSVDRAVRMIRSKSPVAGDLVDALAAADNDMSQRALATLAGDTHLTKPLRKIATIGLSRVHQPGVAAVNALTALVGDPLLGTQAVYGLGTIARRLRENGKTTDSDRVSSQLIAHLKAAGTVSDRIVALRGIANSGYRAAIPEVEGFLTDTDDGTRSAAVQALQLVQDPRADELIATRLRAEEAASPRLAAIEAARLRSPNETVAAALDFVATSSPSENARAKAVEVMGRWAASLAHLRAKVERVAREDPSVDVRRIAQSALTSAVASAR